MSKDWTPEELEAASQMMKAAGYMGYEEFCAALDNGYFTATGSSADRENADSGEPS